MVFKFCALHVWKDYKFLYYSHLIHIFSATAVYRLINKLLQILNRNFIFNYKDKKEKKFKYYFV